MSFKDRLRQFFFSITDRLAASGKHPASEKVLLLVKTDAIGDYILFRNFIQMIATSAYYKDYKVILCGNFIYKELAVTLDSKWIDKFIWIDKKKMVRDILYRFRKIKEISRSGASVTFNPVFSRDIFSGDSLVKASKAKIKVGCVADKSIQGGRQLKKSNGYYTRLVSGFEETVFEFLRNRKVVEEFLSHSVDISKPFIELSKILVNYGDLTEFQGAIIINPSASSVDKRWSPSNFVALINRIAEKADVSFTIVGSKADQNLAESIIGGTRYPGRIKDLTGKTSLTELATIISRARLVISNDTATVHFGAAVNVPVVCISKGDHFGRFTEYPSACGDVRTVYPREIMSCLDDKALLFEKYRYRSHLDIDTISVNEVFAAVSRKLAIK